MGIRNRLKIDGLQGGVWVRIPPRASCEVPVDPGHMARVILDACVRTSRTAHVGSGPAHHPAHLRAPRNGYSRLAVSTESVQETQTFHGGRLVARRLKAHGVSRLFTLSGGHLFSIYDGCRAEGIEIVDVRHESTAGFAAEGWAKVTREPGVCALTAGPGVTNGISAMASAQANHSPMVVLGGRAPAMCWGVSMRTAISSRFRRRGCRSS